MKLLLEKLLLKPVYLEVYEIVNHFCGGNYGAPAFSRARTREGRRPVENGSLTS